MENIHYSSMLADVLSARCSTNKGYSLRAFARDLEMEPAQLSRVLRRKQNISVATATRIAHRLFKEKTKQDLFINLVSLNISKHPGHAQTILAKLRRSRIPPKMLELSWIEVISDWYHTALLDLITLPNSPKTESGLAGYLGLSVHEVVAALKRMERLGLVSRKGSWWVKSSKEMVSPTGIPSAAIRRHHVQMIDKARASIEQQRINERFLYGRTMTVRAADLPRLAELTEDYLNRVAELSEAATCDSLYQVNVQVFNLKSNKKGEQ